MVFDVIENKEYFYQPEQKVITYKEKSSRCTIGEYVVYRGMSESGMYVFERRDNSTIELKGLGYIFSYLPEYSHKNKRRYRYG